MVSYPIVMFVVDTFNAQCYVHVNDAYFAPSTIRFPYETKKIFDRILHELRYLDNVHPRHFTMDLDHDHGHGHGRVSTIKQEGSTESCKEVTMNDILTDFVDQFNVFPMLKDVNASSTSEALKWTDLVQDTVYQIASTRTVNIWAIDYSVSPESLWILL